MVFPGVYYTDEKKEDLLDVVLSSTSKVYTAGDRVEGYVRVDPKLQPVLVKIVFQGYSIIYDSYDNGTKTFFFEFSRTLFKSTGISPYSEILQRGAAADGKVDLPFHFTFPLKVRLAPPSDRIWWHSQDPYHQPLFQHSPGFWLPPSCTPLKSVNEHLPPKVIYQLEARIDTIISDSLPRVRQRLKFIPPAPTYPPALLEPNINLGLSLPKQFCRSKLIRTRKLLPSYERGGNLVKFKDRLAEKDLYFGSNDIEVPYARFNLFATPARTLVIGSQLPLTLTIQHIDRSKSLLAPPDLFLRRLRIQLISTFNVFVPTPAKRDFKETIDKIKSSATLLDKKFPDADGEPLYDGLSLSHLEPIQLVRNNLIPSFSSYGAALEHELQVDLWGECAEREFSGTACREKVQIVSDWSASPAAENEQSSPESHRTDSGLHLQQSVPMDSSDEVETTSITHPVYGPGAVQLLDESLPRYNRNSTPALPLHTGGADPPPYAG